MSETRQTLAGLSRWEIVLWYCLVAISVAIFAWGIALLVRKYRRGRGSIDFERPLARVARSARVILTHAWIRRRDGTAGLAHLLVFYGFLVLLIGSAILAFQDDVTKPALGWAFWEGRFYLGYSLFLDISGGALTVGLAILAFKRLLRPARLDYGTADQLPSAYPLWRYAFGDWLFVDTLFFLAVTGFLLEALRIAQANPSFEKWSPLGWLGAQALRAVGVAGSTATGMHFFLWWLHGVAALAFVAAIPFTKAVHMMTAPASVAVSEERSGQRLTPLPVDAKPEEVGYGVITDLSPGLLLELDACTRCGKCHVACPATASGYPLSPRDLILALRECAEGALGIRRALRIEPLHDVSAAILRNGVRSEAVWSCMQCMACAEICPVGIEHLPVITGLRRRLIEQGEMDATLQTTLEMIHQSGNSFGESRRRRGGWTKALDFEVKDARKEPVDLLWFVGDYASFDPRNQRVAQALARILHGAGVDFGILYEDEQNAGNDVRRVGEEALFADLAERSIKAISRCDFKRIVTTDPHSYNTLKNEYPQFGGEWSVLHHSELLLELLDSGRLVPRRQLDRRVTYHDPCTLGRYNGVYEPPRQILAAIGCQVVEMPHNRDNSFCCGAGGGRIWMSELGRAGAPRPSESRIAEAASLGELDHFVVCCPKDVSVFEDAIKTTGRQKEITLAELSELVLESLDLGAITAT